MQSLILIDCLVVDICHFCSNGGPGVSGHKTGRLCDGPWLILIRIANDYPN